MRRRIVTLHNKNIHRETFATKVSFFNTAVASINLTAQPLPTQKRVASENPGKNPGAVTSLELFHRHTAEQHKAHRALAAEVDHAGRV